MFIYYKHKKLKWSATNLSYDHCCDVMKDMIEHDKTEVHFNVTHDNLSGLAISESDDVDEIKKELKKIWKEIEFKIVGIKNQYGMNVDIDYCPWCGEKIEFRKVEYK